MIHLIRNDFHADRTQGRLTSSVYTAGFDTLEDAVRPYGLKIPDVTAIPAGVYKLTKRMSPSFGREMLCIVTPKFEDSYMIDNGTQEYKYCYLHGGTKPEHSSGCVIMLGMGNDLIWKKLESEIGKPFIITNDYDGVTR